MQRPQRKLRQEQPHNHKSVITPIFGGIFGGAIQKRIYKIITISNSYLFNAHPSTATINFPIISNCYPIFRQTRSCPIFRWGNTGVTVSFQLCSPPSTNQEGEHDATHHPRILRHDPLSSKVSSLWASGCLQKFL